MVSRRRFLLALPLGLPAVGEALSAFAQPRVERIGVLTGGAEPESLESSRYGSFVQGMRELHYAKGRDFVIEWRFAEGHYERFAEFAIEFVRMPVDRHPRSPSSLRGRRACWMQRHIVDGRHPVTHRLIGGKRCNFPFTRDFGPDL